MIQPWSREENEDLLTLAFVPCKMERLGHEYAIIRRLWWGDFLLPFSLTCNQNCQWIVLTPLLRSNAKFSPSFHRLCPLFKWCAKPFCRASFRLRDSWDGISTAFHCSHPFYRGFGCSAKRLLLWSGREGMVISIIHHSFSLSLVRFFGTFCKQTQDKVGGYVFRWFFAELVGTYPEST